MRKLTTTFLTLFLGLSAFSQSTFEKAYFIKNNGERVECLIENNQWYNNPSDFNYKLNKNSEIRNNSIDSVIEFRVADYKYIRENVKLDTSGVTEDTYSHKKEPVFKETKVFLKVLVEGKANLFYYKQKKIERFFLNVDNSEIKPLIYKKYYLKKNNSLLLKVNDRYKFQLMSNLISENLSKEYIYNTSYSKKSLIRLFIKYNELSNQEFFVYKQKKATSHLIVKLSLINSNLKINNYNTKTSSSSYYTYSYAAEFKNELSFSAEVEYEMVLPINRNKWSLFIAPNYQHFKSVKNIEYIKILYHAAKTTDLYIDHESLYIPIGVKYAMYLNSENKLYLDGGISQSILASSVITYENLETLRGSNPFVFAFGGIGYKYKEKYSIDIKYYKLNILYNYFYWNAKYTPITVSLGYTIF